MADNCRKPTHLMVVFAMCLTSPGPVYAQIPSKQQHICESTNTTAARHEIPLTEPLQEAFRSVSLRLHPLDDAASVRTNIIIGFVGGFVKRNDVKHPEVHFAAFLRNSYPPGVHAEVFANHDGKAAFRRVLQLLDSNGDGVITAKEKEQVIRTCGIRLRR